MSWGSHLCPRGVTPVLGVTPVSRGGHTCVLGVTPRSWGSHLPWGSHTCPGGHTPVPGGSHTCPGESHTCPGGHTPVPLLQAQLLTAQLRLQLLLRPFLLLLHQSPAGTGVRGRGHAGGGGARTGHSHDRGDLWAQLLLGLHQAALWARGGHWSAQGDTSGSGGGCSVQGVTQGLRCPRVSQVFHAGSSGGHSGVGRCH